MSFFVNWPNSILDCVRQIIVILLVEYPKSFKKVPYIKLVKPFVTDSPINSYYEEALEIIRSKSQLQHTQNVPLDGDYNDDDDAESFFDPSAFENLEMKTANLMENLKTAKFPPLISSVKNDVFFS